MLILKFDLDNRRQDNYHGQPQIQSLATQLQKQKIAPDGPSGYSKFKQEYGQVITRILGRSILTLDYESSVFFTIGVDMKMLL